MVMHVDDALRLLGRYSRWQMLVYIMLGISCWIPFAWAMMAIIFIADVPDYTCKPPPDITMNDSIPVVYDNGRWRWSQCSQYVNKSQSNVTQTCQHGYQYDPNSGYESTIVTDFDLVCDRGWLGELAMSIVCLGQTVGALVSTVLSDRYGRRKVYLTCLWSYMICGMVKAFSHNYTMFVILTFINGFQLQGMCQAGAILTMELFPTDQRTFAGAVIEVFWASGFLSLTFLAYMIRNWRYLQLAITVPLAWTIIFYWCMPESIPWLVANGRAEEAENIMKKAANFNKVKIPNYIFTNSDGENLSKEGKEKLLCEYPDTASNQNGMMEWNKETVTTSSRRSAKFKHLFTSKALRWYTPAIAFIWFTNCLVYYGVSLTVTSLAGDRYLNVFLYAAVEVPGFILTGILMQKIGRVIPLASFHLICGLALLATIVQTFELGSVSVPLSITFSMLAKMAITSSFAVIVVITPELYPTNIRSKGNGICGFSSRIASYIAPFARVLDRWQGWVPRVIFAIFSLLAAFAVIFLPETRWRPLPETVEEVDEWRHQPKFYKPVKRGEKSETKF